MIPTSTDVRVQASAKWPLDVEAVAVFVTQGAPEVPAVGLPKDQRDAVRRVLRAGVIKGKVREVGFDLVERGRGKLQRVFVVGLGPEEKVKTQGIREAAGTLAKALRKHRIETVAVAPPGVDSVDGAEACEAVVTGLMLASFRFREFEGSAKKQEDEAKEQRPLRVTVVGEDQAELRAAVERGRIIAAAQNFARTVASRPGNVINPPALAEVAREMGKEVGLDVRVLDEKQMEKLGMGGILAVGSGSNKPPRMIVLQHRPGGIKASRASAKTGKRMPVLLVVGKSITFDTGGISIKPAEKMGDMIFDKCGGMAVLGLMYAAAKLKLPVHLVGILTSAENMPGSRAYRPGDILRLYNGVTVEVTNTDAEGRLVLGDALAWGIETYKPAAVVDLATLTGGCVVALGHTQAGLMSNSDDLVNEIERASARAGEKVWRLPVGDDERELIKSQPADIVNSAGRWASPLQGGAFLSYFVPKDGSVPWAHLDIAGVADTDKELPLYARGATAWGVRTLVEWVSERAGERRDRAVPPPAGG